jgi:8-oxo-dGTP pyrophosphatase MutT (NUDIX family)
VTSLASVETFLRGRLAQPLPGARAHRRFAPRPPRKNWQPGVIPDSARRAAALILLYPHETDVYFVLTERHADLPHHPGQISLPGGRIDADERADDAALREAHEEIGIDRPRVRLVGALSPVFVGVSNFAIQPFVGVTDQRPAFRVAQREVAALIEVPLAHLPDPSRLHWGTRTREGYLVEFPYFDLAGHQVWGATAMMLGELAWVLEERGATGATRS